MPRSAESRARRRDYAKHWRETHPTYHAEWRAQHRESENERIRRWRLTHPELVRAQRERWRQRTRSTRRDVDYELPASFTGHGLFDLARSIVGPRPRFDEHIWEEAVSEAVLALLEGRDAREAARKAFRCERSWRVQHPPIYSNADVTSDGRLVITGPHD